MDQRALQLAFRRWVRQAWAKKTADSLKAYVQSDRVRALKGLFSRKADALMKRGFAHWRQQT